MINLLSEAKQKWGKQNLINDYDYDLPMDTFIQKIYLDCDPASYGNKFVNKLIKDCSVRNINLYKTKISDDKADLFQTYNDYDFVYEGLGSNLFEHLTNVKKTFYEVKISYLSKKSLYSLRNIRKYQIFDYYILCFVDCENDFTPNFYVKEKSFIESFGMSAMNGTKNANANNDKIGYGKTFFKYSDEFYSFQHLGNVLNGTSYSDLQDFLNENRENLK